MPEAARSDELRVRSEGSSDRRNIGNVAGKEVFLRMLAQGMRSSEAAQYLGRNRETLIKWARDPEFAARLKELNSEAFAEIDAEIKVMATNTVKRITAASDEALDTVLELMREADSEVVRLKSAQDVLDRNPETSKTHKVERKESVVHIDAKFLTLAAEAEKETTIDGQ